MTCNYEELEERLVEEMKDSLQGKYPDNRQHQ
jgi:hypothetical protein